MMTDSTTFPAPFTVIPIKGLGVIKEGDDVGALICAACQKMAVPVEEDDVLVVAQTIVSRAEGAIIDLASVKPSRRAKRLASKLGKRPELVEVILQASKRVVRAEQGHLIVETHHGFVCANAGVDSSNVHRRNHVTLLPEDPDRSAQLIRHTVKQEFGVDVAVIISDTHGRPFRMGAINVAVGTSGIAPLKRFVGQPDLFGYTLRTTSVAVADELASAAELVMGEADEGVPVVLIRGYCFDKAETSARVLIREESQDIFRR
jgi:coenzyme F420-0:L-glutamate ligase/coenzyme F420-1:gamma-L-glutamate ligase